MTFRRRSGLGAIAFVGALFMLIALMIFLTTDDGLGFLFALCVFAMGLALMFAQPRIELDFVRMRFRTYSMAIFARESDFKAMPKLDRIQVRDVTYPGGRAGSRYSWGDTYSYEVFLMSVANEKLVVCERPSKARIKAIVCELAKTSGLSVRDVTKEQILN